MKKLTFISLCFLFSQQVFSGLHLNEVTLGLGFNNEMKQLSPSNLIIRYDGTMNKKARQATIPITYKGDNSTHEEDSDNLSLSLSEFTSDDVTNNRQTQLSTGLVESIISVAAQYNFITSNLLIKKIDQQQQISQSIRHKYYSRLGMQKLPPLQKNKAEDDSLEELLNSIGSLSPSNY